MTPFILVFISVLQIMSLIDLKLSLNGDLSQMAGTKLVRTYKIETNEQLRKTTQHGKKAEKREKSKKRSNP